MKQTETQLQKSILDYLQLMENQRKCYCFRSASGAISTADGRYFKTGRKGIQDITCILPEGKFLALEVKNIYGQQSSAQRETEGRIKMLGGQYHIVKSVDDVMKLIK